MFSECNHPCGRLSEMQPSWWQMTSRPPPGGVGKKKRKKDELFSHNKQRIWPCMRLCLVQEDPKWCDKYYKEVNLFSSTSVKCKMTLKTILVRFNLKWVFTIHFHIWEWVKNRNTSVLWIWIMIFWWWWEVNGISRCYYVVRYCRKLILFDQVTLVLVSLPFFLFYFLLLVLSAVISFNWLFLCLTKTMPPECL